jgi:hypothetical protein
MTLRSHVVLAAAFLFMVPAVSNAALVPYSQDFETLVMADPAALSADGWLVFGNVFSPDHSVYYYGYGTFPAPNPGGGFSAIVNGQGGAGQGAQQLSIYSDYNNADHANGNQIESNVFVERTIGAGDVGSTWTFQFDAKLGNLVAPTTAIAFIKTLNPAAGYATTNFLTADMAAIPTSWGTYTISINIDNTLPGQILQIGFANTATHYDGSGVFYDNILFRNTSVTPTKPSSWGQLKALYR